MIGYTIFFTLEKTSYDESQPWKNIWYEFYFMIRKQIYLSTYIIKNLSFTLVFVLTAKRQYHKTYTATFLLFHNT